MRASVHVDLPGYTKEGVKILQARCEELHLQPRGNKLQYCVQCTLYKYTLLYSIKKNVFPEFYNTYVGTVPVQVHCIMYILYYAICICLLTVGTSVYLNVNEKFYLDLFPIKSRLLFQE